MDERERMEEMKIKSEKPHIISRELSEVLGWQAAAVISQVHYWVRKNEGKKRNLFDGKYWTYNTYKEWRRTNFAFWTSELSVKRWVKATVDAKFLLKRRSKYKIWLTPNYAQIEAINPATQPKIHLASKKYQSDTSQSNNVILLQPPQRVLTEIPLTEDYPAGSPPQTLSNVSKTENLASEKYQSDTSQLSTPSAPASYPGWQYDRVLQRASEILSDDYAGIDYLETHEKDKASEYRGIKILFGMGFSYKDVIEGINKLSQQGNPRTFMFRQNDDLNRLLKFMEKKIVPSVGQKGGGDE